MFIKKAVFVNWGNIPKLEFEFGPVNLFSGGNGSGKTTAADALQALMTAAHDNLFAFNPGQDETTQKGRGGKQVRTLASYLLGCDDGSYARPHGTDGYVAAVFHPTEGEVAEPFSAIMAMRGHLDEAGNQKQARLSQLFFMIISGESVSLDCFVREFKDGKHIKPVNEVAAFLKQRFANSNVEVYDKKGAYLRRLYGALRGRNDAVSDREAKHAARTLANFMAYKPVKSIHDFVAGEILEAKDLGDAIRNVSDLMKTIHQMESSASTIKEAIGLLETAGSVARNYIDTWVDVALNRYTEASRLVIATQSQYLALAREKKQAQAALTQANERSELARERKQRLHQSIVQLEARRQGISELREKDRWQKTAHTVKQKIDQCVSPFLQAVATAKANADCAEHLVQSAAQTSLALNIRLLSDNAFLKSCRQLTQMAELRALDARHVFNDDWLGDAQLEALLDKAVGWQSAQNQWVSDILGLSPVSSASDKPAESLLATLRSLLSERRNQVSKCQSDALALSNDIHLLEGAQVAYPAHVVQAIKTIEQTCPSAKPKVLCDYVEVTDAKWQMAIEGYMGGARFAILVDEQYEAEAIAAVRAIRSGKRNQARVVQGRKALRDADRLSVASDSIVKVMSFNHAIAEAYLQASYGNVVRVNSAETLKKTARGITADGLASGNYSLFRCDVHDSDLVFGQGARSRALKAKTDDWHKAQQRLQEAESEAAELEKLIAKLEQVAPCQMADLLEQLVELHHALREAEQQLADVSVSDGEQLEEELQKAHEGYSAQEEAQKQCEQDVGRSEAIIASLEKKISQLLDEQDQAEKHREILEDAVQDIARVHPRFDIEQALKEADQHAEKTPEASFAEQTKHLQDQLAKQERELFNVLQRYNLNANVGDSVFYDSDQFDAHSFDFFKQVVNVQASVEALHTRFKNNILVTKHKELASLKETFNTAFVTNLCHSIYQAINEGESALQELNNELAHHRFGADRETYSFATQWVPEYKEYWQFFKAVVSNPQLGDGTTLFELDLDKKHARVRDELLSMLLDEDEHTAHRELQRISDYRNYRRYEIYKEPENKAPIALSEYGTGSGGQLETPAYIIRSAAVTSAFRFNEGKAHLRMVMVDEAFSKMDEGRSREVIHYLTEALGLQLVFIMPTSKSGPFLDLISNQFVFAKCPTLEPVGELQTRVFVDRKVCNTDKIKALWANHRKVIRHQAMLDFMEEFA